MNMRRITALAAKEWREILRDRIFFSLAFIVPLVWMLVFGYGLTLDVENVPIAILDYDRSSLSRDYSHRFTDSRYFDFKGYLKELREADRLLGAGQVRAVIIIPEQFQENLLNGRRAEVQSLIDGSFPVRAETIQGYVEAINAAMSGALQVQYITRSAGLSPSQAQTLIEPLRIEVRYLYNQELRSIWSIAPSLIMFTLMLASPLLTALSIVREKETGAIYNIYASTVTRLEFLAGKLLPNVTISAVNAMILWLVAVFYFGAPFKGDIVFFVCATLLYVLCTSSIGLLVSLLVRTQMAALVASTIIAMIPAIQFSGMLVPVSSLSGSGYVQAHLFPPMYYNNVLMGSFLKGVGLETLWPNAAVLALYSGLLLALCYVLFHKRTKT